MAKRSNQQGLWLEMQGDIAKEYSTTTPPLLTPTETYHTQGPVGQVTNPAPIQISRGNAGKIPMPLPSSQSIEVTSSRPESDQLSRHTRKSKSRLIAALEEQDAN